MSKSNAVPVSGPRRALDAAPPSLSPVKTPGTTSRARLGPNEKD